MNKLLAIHLLGDGSVANAARTLGVRPNSVSRWAIDERGNITSRLVQDMVLAAHARLSMARYRKELLEQGRDLPDDDIEFFGLNGQG